MKGPVTLSSNRHYFYNLIILARNLLQKDNLVCFLPTLPVIDSPNDIPIDESVLLAAHKVKIDHSQSVLVFNIVTIGDSISEEIRYAIVHNKHIYFVFEPDDRIIKCYENLGIRRDQLVIEKRYNNTFNKNTGGFYECTIRKTL